MPEPDAAGSNSTPTADRPVKSAEKKANQAALTVAAWALLSVVVVAPTSFRSFVDKPVENWTTIFLSLTLQALPFLVLGVVISAAISAFVPSRWLVRAFPSSAAAESSAHDTKDFVPYLVPVLVVDGLEVVEIEVQESKGLASGAESAQHVAEPGPVGNPGELVGFGSVSQEPVLLPLVG